MEIFTLSFFQGILHYFLHFVAPFFLARLFFRDMWKKAFLIMIATMAVDLDHLAADPIFDPTRCSIGFHILHSYVAIGVYALMLLVPQKIVRIIATGLLFHMFTDFTDCNISRYVEKVQAEQTAEIRNE